MKIVSKENNTKTSKNSFLIFLFTISLASTILINWNFCQNSTDRVFEVFKLFDGWNTLKNYSYGLTLNIIAAVLVTKVSKQSWKSLPINFFIVCLLFLIAKIIGEFFLDLFTYCNIKYI